MKNESWILGEITKWQSEELISHELAEKLSERYAVKRNTSYMMTLFSLLGAILIGAGIILICAKNWYQMPFSVRVTLAFLPLVLSQGLAFFTLRYKKDSLAWRESVAILVAASVFTAVALVGQIYHLSGDFDTYVLTCGILSLPMMFLLDAVSIMLVYDWAVLVWAGNNANDPMNAILLLGLFALSALYLLQKRKCIDGRFIYATWITAIAGIFVAFFSGGMLQSNAFLITFCYFVAVLSVCGMHKKALLPLQILGTVGTLVMLFILTYRGMWSGPVDGIYLGGTVMAAILLLTGLLFAVLQWKKNRMKSILVFTTIGMCILRYIWVMTEFPGIYGMLITNAVLLGIGIGFMIQGTRKKSLLITNVGMLTLCVLILMRFFDSEMQFLWRGIVFVLLGIAFLIVNLAIVRRKKVREGAES